MIKRAALFIAVLSTSGFLFAFAPSGDSHVPTTGPTTAPALTATSAIDMPGLHNVVTYDDRLVCGGVPNGDVGFATLEAMGIKTVISVDGALPDLELAKKHGLRYVHLPIGYNGMDVARSAEIARAVRDLPKPIYLHCHHGKHRSAGASASAAVLLGWLSPEEGLAKMKVSGTAANYKGLFEAVTAASKCEKDVIDQASTAFPELSKPSSFVDAMIEVDDVTDKLKLIDKAGWVAPADHPDLVPAAEAGQLADHFRNLQEDPESKAKPQDFNERLKKDMETMTAIEEGIVAKAPATELSTKFKVVLQSCKDCHTAHRDAEKPIH